MPDITGRADLEALLRDFYGRAFEDPLLRHVFVDVARMDLDAHLPVIVGFWEKVLFDVGTYSGRTMEVHRRLHEHVALSGTHFARWLELWRESIRSRFAGPVAEAADAHATRMAAVFVRNLGEPRRARSLPLVPGRPRPL